MARFEQSSFSRRFRKGWRFLLAFFWCSGLLCGILVSFSAEDTFSSWMRMNKVGSVSIVSLLCVSLVPFLLSAFAVFISMPSLMLPVCFCKAFLFAFVSVGVMQAYGSAGWLIRNILLFSDCLTAPVLYLFWLRIISSPRRNRIWEGSFLCALLILIGSLDHRVFSPLVAGLLS